MAGGSSTYTSAHTTTLTGIGGLWGFWCTCGRSTVGWRLKDEAENAAAQHRIGNKPYGTCIYCTERGELTRFGWCVSCHPRLSETKTHCVGCGAYTQRVRLSRDFRCDYCLVYEAKWADLQQQGAV